MGGPLQAGLLMELGFPSWKRGGRSCMWVGRDLLLSDSFSSCPMWKCAHVTACGLRMEREVGLLILLSPKTRKWDHYLPPWEGLVGTGPVALMSRVCFDL